MVIYTKTGGGGGGPPKAYLDTNIVSAIVRRNIPPDEVSALFALLEVMHDGRLALVTSKVTKEEIDCVPEQHRAPHEGVFALLTKIPLAVEQRPFPQIVQPVRPGVPR